MALEVKGDEEDEEVADRTIGEGSLVVGRAVVMEGATDVEDWLETLVVSSPAAVTTPKPPKVDICTLIPNGSTPLMLSTSGLGSGDMTSSQV